MHKVPEPTQEPEPAATTRGRTALRRVTVGALALVLISVCAIGALGWQATRGGVSLDFLQSSLSSTIQGRLPANSSVTIGSTAVSWRGDQGLILRARDVKVALPNVATVALAEFSTVTTASAVLARRIDFDSVTVSGAAIEIVAPVGINHEGSPADIARSAAKAFTDQVLQTDNLIRGAGLENVLVRDGTIRLSDRDGKAGPALRISEANWVPLGADRSKVWLQVIEKNGAGWDLTVERQVSSEGGAAVNLKVEHLPMEALDPDFANSEGRDGFHEAAVSFQARAVLGEDGSFRGVRGVFSTGSGPLSVSGLDRIEVAGTAFSFALPPTGDRIAIPGGEIRTRAGNVRFDAALDLGQPQTATLIARVQGGLLPTIGTDPGVEVTGGELLARVDLRTQVVDVERFRLSAADGSVSAAGVARFAGPDAGIEFALSLTEIPAIVARAFWPPFVADKTRKWFDENVRSGTLGPTTLKVALPRDHIGKRGRDRVLPEGALSGTLPFRDAVFSPATMFPVMREASGDVYFEDATATVLTQNGLIRIEGRGDLQAAGTILVIPELGKPRLWGDLHLQLDGPAAALAALSDLPPLLVASKRDIRADALSGNAQLSLDDTVPLFEGGSLDPSPNFRLALTDFSSKAPIKNRLIGDADLVLDGTAQSFTVKGQANLDGLQASVDLVLGDDATSQSDVSVSLDDAARERLGLGLGGILTGPVQATIKESGDATQQIGLDLAQARISLPSMGWEKGPGVAATAAFVMAKTEAGTRITDLTISGKGFQAKGELFITPDGKLQDLSLAEFALRPGDQLSVTAKAKNGGYDVGVRGRALDARGIIRGIGAKGGGSGGSDMFPLRIALDLQAVSGENDVVLSDVKGTATITAKGLEAVSLEGAANRTQRFEWKLGKEGGARTLGLRANNGGALIRFAGLYRKITDGTLVLDYRGTSGGAGTGVMVMRDFHLQGETALAPAVESARQVAARSREDAPRAQNSGDLHFTQLRIPFRQDRWVISIDDAALRGPMLGATATGTVNIPGKKMALSGTLIPAFGLNNIAGAIPIIGTILGGGRDEGLVGITYKLFGPIDGPKLAMNPISAIAPGIFRKIFEYR